nr:MULTISPECIES: GntR family transcriptional regulator [Lysinibacillus]
MTVQLKEAILANKLQAGDALPSIRALAKDFNYAKAKLIRVDLRSGWATPWGSAIEERRLKPSR